MKVYKSSEIFVLGILKTLTVYIPVIIAIIFVIYEFFSTNSNYNTVKNKEIASNDYDKANAYYTVNDYKKALDILLVYEKNGDAMPDMIILTEQCKNKIAESEEFNIKSAIEQGDYVSAKMLLGNTEYMDSNIKMNLSSIIDEGMTNLYFEKFKELNELDEQISLIIELENINLCGENQEEFEKMIADAVSQYSNTIINRLSGLSTYEEKIEYLQKSKDYFVTDDITEALSSNINEYVKNTLLEVEKIYKTEGIEGVIFWLENARKLDESNEDINKEIDYWKEKKENKIEINKSNIENNILIMTSATNQDVIKPKYYDNGIVDSRGNNYLYGFELDNWGYSNKPGEAEFLINEKYDFLRFTYAPRKCDLTGKNIYLKVFVDEKLVLDVPGFTDLYVDPLTTVINVSGAKRVKFCIPPTSTTNYGGWLILEPELL